MGMTTLSRNSRGEVISWCGCPMQFAGYGAYPYDCDHARKYPTAAIYEKGDCKHAKGRVWTADLADFAPTG